MRLRLNLTPGVASSGSVSTSSSMEQLVRLPRFHAKSKLQLARMGWYRPLRPTSVSTPSFGKYTPFLYAWAPMAMVLSPLDWAFNSTPELVGYCAFHGAYSTRAAWALKDKVANAAAAM